MSMKKLYKVKCEELKKELKVDSFVWWAKPVASLIVIIRMINHWLLKDGKDIN